MILIGIQHETIRIRYSFVLSRWFFLRSGLWPDRDAVPLIVNPDSVSHNFYERETVKGVSRVMCLRHLSDIESDVTRLLE